MIKFTGANRKGPGGGAGGRHAPFQAKSGHWLNRFPTSFPLPLRSAGPAPLHLPAPAPAPAQFPADPEADLEPWRSRSVEGYSVCLLHTGAWWLPGPQTCTARVWGPLRTLKFSRPPVPLVAWPCIAVRRPEPWDQLPLWIKITRRRSPAAWLPRGGVDATCVVVFPPETFQRPSSPTPAPAEALTGYVDSRRPRRCPPPAGSARRRALPRVGGVCRPHPSCDTRTPPHSSRSPRAGPASPLAPPPLRAR